MGAVMLSIGSFGNRFYCSHAEILFLKLFVYQDQSAYAYHCSTTHHKAACPVVANYIELLMQKRHKDDLRV